MRDVVAGDAVALPTDAGEARAAAEQAAAKLTATYRRWPSVHQLAARLDASRDPDELAERISQAYRAR